MKLCTLLNQISLKGVVREPQREINALSVDSRRVEQEDLFLLLEEKMCLRMEYLGEAIEKKVAVVVCPEEDRVLDLEKRYKGVSFLYSENTRKDYALLSANWFSRPAEQLLLIGVTGTNGKTTTTHIIKSMLENMQDGRRRKIGLIGTNENKIGAVTLPSSRTTPDAFELHRLFREMVDASCTHVVMEVSSHGLDQERTGGLFFEVGVFTNLTQDHLDYHETMEAYQEAKSKLFLQCHHGVFNLDDETGRELAQRQTCSTLTYSENKRYATLYGQQLEVAPHSISFEAVRGSEKAAILLPIPGGFSLYNALAALVCGLALGLQLPKLAATFPQIEGVKGRLERVPTPTDYTVMIDYAHTPNALENILLTAKNFTKGRLICVFGCGGNRDRSKRWLMGSIAENIADVVVVTSDNPRFEKPMDIISDILLGLEGEYSSSDTGVDGTQVKIIEERKEAIWWALSQGREGDVLVLAGKGHECYQETCGIQTPFDEREIVSSYFALQGEIPPEEESVV